MCGKVYLRCKGKTLHCWALSTNQTNKPRSSRGLVIFDTLWQFFVIVFGWIGRIEKILSNNERQIINFKANFVDETVISGISGHE